MYYLCIFETGSHCSPGWPRTCQPVKDNCERLTVQPLPPECWNRGLNPESCPCQASPLPSEPHLSPVWYYYILNLIQNCRETVEWGCQS